MSIATAHHWGWYRKVAMSFSSTPEPQEQGKIWGGWSHLGHILLTLCIPATVNIFYFLEIPLFCSTSGPLHLLVPVLEMFFPFFLCLRTPNPLFRFPALFFFLEPFLHQDWAPYYLLLEQVSPFFTACINIMVDQYT